MSITICNLQCRFQTRTYTKYIQSENAIEHQLATSSNESSEKGQFFGQLPPTSEHSLENATEHPLRLRRLAATQSAGTAARQSAAARSGRARLLLRATPSAGTAAQRRAAARSRRARLLPRAAPSAGTAAQRSAAARSRRVRLLLRATPSAGTAALRRAAAETRRATTSRWLPCG